VPGAGYEPVILLSICGAEKSRKIWSIYLSTPDAAVEPAFSKAIMPLHLQEGKTARTQRGNRSQRMVMGNRQAQLEKEQVLKELHESKKTKKPVTVTNSRRPRNI